MAQTHRTRNPFNEFSEGITIGNNIIFRIHLEERDRNPNGVYFLGQVVEISQKLCAPGSYSSTWFQRNDWIVKILWYSLSSIASNGNNIYEKWGYPQYIHYKTIVRSFTR